MSDIESYDASDLRELIGDDIEEVDQHAGIIRDPLMSRVFSYLKEAYDPLVDEMPDSFYETKVAKQILSQHGTTTATRALEDGSLPLLAYITGRTDDGEIEVKDWREYEMLVDLFRDEPTVSDFTNETLNGILFSSTVPPTGRGKSSTFYELIGMAQVPNPDLTVITNNANDPYLDTPELWEELEVMIDNIEGQTLLGLDEVAQFLQYADQKEGKTVSQLLKRLRHMNCHFLGIAHTGADIPKDIRRQVFFFDKLSRKRMEVGYGIESTGKDRMQIADVMFTVSSIPHTPVSYGSKEDDKDDEIIEIVFEEEDEYDTCRGWTKNGGECNQHGGLCEHGFCRSHRDQCSDCGRSDVESETGGGSTTQERTKCAEDECQVDRGLDEDGYCPSHGSDGNSSNNDY